MTFCIGLQDISTEPERAALDLGGVPSGEAQSQQDRIPRQGKITI